jgi:hypothetical protein
VVEPAAFENSPYVGVRSDKHEPAASRLGSNQASKQHREPLGAKRAQAPQIEDDLRIASVKRITESLVCVKRCRQVAFAVQRETCVRSSITSDDKETVWVMATPLDLPLPKSTTHGQASVFPRAEEPKR